MELDKEYLNNVHKGERLKVFTSNQSWQDVLDIMENRCKIAEDFLLNFQGTDLEVIRNAHRSAVAKRDFFHQVQQDINGFIKVFESKDDELKEIEEDEFA